jgi:hypothetical protein
MKKFLIIIGLVIGLSSCIKYTSVNPSNNMSDALRGLMDYAYFEGQKDALNGDIRIEMRLGPNGKDSMYVWTTSPWDSGEEPKYTPNVTDSKPNKMNVAKKSNIQYK